MTDKIFKKLPVVHHTNAIKNFFDNTVEQLFSKSNVELVKGFIGSQRGNDHNVDGAYIVHPTASKRFYSLSPTINTKAVDTNSPENLIFYDEFIDLLKSYGVQTKDHNKIFSDKFSTFLPPINVDKFINYQEYYWVPEGPSVITVTGTVTDYIDIERDILGKKTYTLPNGKEMRNGMKISFSGNYVTPASQTSITYIVTGVGESINLAKFSTDTPASYRLDTSVAWEKDYIIQEQGAVNKNVWSRVNHWYHIENFRDAGDDIPSKTKRAYRPILEFNNKLELYNHGEKFHYTVDASAAEYSFSDVDGASTGSLFIDNVGLGGAFFIFPNESKDISQYIYFGEDNSGTIKLVRVADPSNPQGAADGDDNFIPLKPSIGSTILTDGGIKYLGSEYVWSDAGWKLAQHKINVNQAPLFNLYDNKGICLADVDVYPQNNFRGNKIFGYAVDLSAGEENTAVSQVNDTELGFPLVYKQFKASSEIVFENYQKTAYCTFIPIGGTSTKNIVGYKFYKLQKTEVEYHAYWKQVKESNKQKVISTYDISQPVIDRQIKDFNIGAVPITNSAVNSGYEIEVTINNVPFTGFQYNNVGNGFIRLDSITYKLNDLIEISVNTNSGLIDDTSTSKYELPLSWKNNVLKQELSATSEPQYMEHFSEYISKQESFSGVTFGSNNSSSIPKTDSYANKIINTDQNTILGALLLDDQPHNLVDALRFNKSEYIKFKNRIKSEINKYYSTKDTDGLAVSDLLEQIIRNTQSYKVGRDVFNRTYILPYGDNYTEQQFTAGIVDTVAERTFTSIYDADLDKIENSLLVYHNQKLLTVDVDYVISSFSPITVTIQESANLSTADEVVFKLYDAERDSAQCPPTPSTMGTYPLFQPEISTDNSFTTPLKVIIGHDGSKTPLLGDLRDDLMLEFEKRIYNSAKAEFRTNNSMPEHSVFSSQNGAFRTTGFDFKEFNDLMIHSYASWLQRNEVDGTSNDFFKSDDKFTWNYSSGADLPGHWKGFYLYYYDTIRPHTHPWEMLGFTEKPLWWDQQYALYSSTDVNKVSPIINYSPTNKALWEDLEQGIIRQGPRSNLYRESYKTNNPFRRIGLHEVMPVTSDALLISPAEIISTETTTRTVTWNNEFVNASVDIQATSFNRVDSLTVSTDSSNLYIQSNTIPNHALDGLHFENSGHATLDGDSIEFESVSYNIPKVTLNTIPSTPSGTAVTQGTNAVAVALNGIPVYNIKSQTSWKSQNEWHYINVEASHDNNVDHASVNDGVLHYHVLSPRVAGLTAWSTTEHSPIVGWALDGLPIYGPYGYSDSDDSTSSITRIQSPWTLRSGTRTSGPGGAYTGQFVEDWEPTGSGDTYTNAYNVRYAKTPESPDTKIRFYVATVDANNKPAFPYHVGGGAGVGVSGNNVYQNRFYNDPHQVGFIKEINIVNKGGQYTNATVAITGDGTGATATATIVDGSIEGITITNKGQNYTTASATIQGDGYRAIVSVVIDDADNSKNKGYINPSASTYLQSTKIVTLTESQKINERWAFGDCSPAEYAWRSTEEFPYAMTEALLLAKPGLFATMFSNPVALIRPTCNKDYLLNKVTGEFWKFNNTTEFTIHGELDQNKDFITSIGYSQFIYTWLKFQNLDITTDFANKLRTLDINLAQRMSGFVDKDTLVARTDQYSNDGNATSLIIPQENINVNLHSSNYKSRNFYSGVVIEKTATGYMVRGFDRNRGYFNSLPVDPKSPKGVVSVGGEPVASSNWAPSTSYTKGTIVEYNRSYYKAKINITSDSTFEAKYWDALPKLPQQYAAEAAIYKVRKSIPERVYYDTQYDNIQDVFDLLIGIGAYNNQEGFDFGEFDGQINDVNDWIYAGKQFLFWTTGKWEIGNTIELSPLASRLRFNAPRGFIAKINRTDRDQFSIIDQVGAVIDPTMCQISREGSVIEILPPQGQQIYGCMLFTKEIEHALVFDNRTVFADVIFDDTLDQKHRRIKLKANRTRNWTGKFLSEGFIIDGDELRPNLDNMAESLGRYHELGFIPVEKQLYEQSRALFGFEERSYLKELDILDEEQFSFYQGMIQNKGTKESLTRIANSNSIVQGNITVFDEWALRVGDFGNTKNNQHVELKLYKTDFKQNSQLIKLDYPQSTTNCIERIDVFDARYRYEKLPTIEISQPVNPNGKQAIAIASLDANNKLESITVTDSGSGYDDPSSISARVVASNVLINETKTTLDNALAIGNTYIVDGTSLNLTLVDNITESNVSLTVTNTDGSSNVTGANIATAINSNALLNVNITASVINNYTDTDNAQSTITLIAKDSIVLSGSDFTVHDGANIGVVNARYQPQQKFSLEGALADPNSSYETKASDIIVEVDNINVPQSDPLNPLQTYWTFDEGSNFNLTTSVDYPTIDVNTPPSGDNIGFPLTNNSVTINFPSGSNIHTNNLVKGDNSQYKYVEVYINNVRIFNSPSTYTSDGTVVANGNIFVLNNNSITLNDISLLPSSVLTARINPPQTYEAIGQRDTVYTLASGTVIQIIERPTLTFTDNYVGDLPNSVVRIKVTAKEGIAPRVGLKRTYDIVPSNSNDILVFDIDDSSRFLRKPSGDKVSKLWPTTANVDILGMTDVNYPKVSNAGYVNSANVNFLAFDIESVSDLHKEEFLFKPKQNDYIHIATSENQDWNVYQLAPAGEDVDGLSATNKINYLERNNTGNVSLYTNYSLLEYIDSNQIGELNTGKYLDFVLSLQNANVSDKIVVWNNEKIIREATSKIRGFEAPRQIEARIQSIGPLETITVQSTEPSSGIRYTGLRASIVNSVDGNTVQLTGSIGTIVNGDAVQVIDNVGTQVTRSAVSSIVSSGNVSLNATSIANLTITSAGTGYTSAPTVTVTPDLGANITANIEGNVSTVNITTDNNFQSANVAINGGGGSGATVRTDIYDAEIVGFTINNGGSGYLFTGPDADGDFNPTNTVTVTVQGSATAEINESDVDPVTGEVLNVTVLNGGSGYSSDSPPTVSISGTGGSGIDVTPILQGNVRAVVTNIGSGYTQPPAVTIIGDGTGFSGEAVLNAKVTALNVNKGGTGYTSTPTISISGSATATPNMNFGNAEIDQNILDDSSNSFANTTIRVTGTVKVDTTFGLPSEANVATIQKINSLFTKEFNVIGYSENPTHALLHVNEPLLEDANVTSNIDNLSFVISSFKDYSNDSGTYYIASNVTGRSFTITRPNSYAGNGLTVRHLNNTKLVTGLSEVAVAPGDIIRVNANNFEGMFKAKTVSEGNITIASPYTLGYTSGTIFKQGLKIKTVGDHGISPLYADYGKRIAVHFANPKSYNQIYSIDKVTPKELHVNGRWAKTSSTQTYYDHKIGTLNGSVPYIEGDINADYANSTNSISLTRSTDLLDTVVMYAGNSQIVNPRFVSIVEDGSVCVISSDALPSNTTISVDIDVQRDMGRNILYPQLSTVDHGVVTLKGSQQHLTSYYNPKALENDLNRTIKLKQSYTDASSMTTVNPKTGLPAMQLKIPMLKSPWLPVFGDTPAPLIHDYGPYVASSETLNKLVPDYAQGTMVLGSDDEAVIDPSFYKGAKSSGPIHGLRWTNNNINYIYDYDLQQYVPETTIYNEDKIVNETGDTELKKTPEFHVNSMNTDQLTAPEREALVLKQIPGTATSLREWRPGRKQLEYNMLDQRTFTVGSDTVTIPSYRLKAIKNENVFLIYQAVQNTNNNVYYIKVDESNPPNLDHDFNATINRYADVGLYDATDYYWTNDIMPSIDGDDKITDVKDPVRLRKIKNIVNLKTVEPAAYIGPALIPEPFALVNGNNSDRTANFTALPLGTQVKLESFVDYDPGVAEGGAEGEKVFVPETGFGRFLIWTPGMTPGEWAPTPQGPGTINGNSLGYGSGYYAKGDDHNAIDYPDVSDLTYDKPIARFKYSNRFNVDPAVYNEDRRNYVINDVTYTEDELSLLTPERRTREGDPEQAFWDGIFEDINGVDREIDYNFFFDEEWWDYLEIDNLVTSGIANELDNDTDNTLLRPEHIFVSCFWTEPHTYSNQVTGYDYNELDADGNPAPIVEDYNGTAVCLKYIRLTELPPNAITRRLVPDTGWAGKGWNNITVDRAVRTSPTYPDVSSNDISTYIDQFDPVLVSGGSTDDDIIIVDLPALAATSTPIPIAGSTAQNNNLSNTRLLSSGELEQQLGFQVVPTGIDGAPVDTLAKLTQAPGPCLAVTTPDDPTPPGTTAPGVCTDKQTQMLFETMHDGLNSDADGTYLGNTYPRSVSNDIAVSNREFAKQESAQVFFDSKRYETTGGGLSETNPPASVRFNHFYFKTVEIATSGDIDLFLNSNLEAGFDRIKKMPFGNATGYVIWQSDSPLSSEGVEESRDVLVSWISKDTTRLLKSTMNNANDIPSRSGDQISRYGIDNNLAGGNNKYTQVDAVFGTTDTGFEGTTQTGSQTYQEMTFTNKIESLNDDNISVKWTNWDSSIQSALQSKGFAPTSEFGMQGIGYIRATNVDCNKGKYITIMMVPSQTSASGPPLVAPYIPLTEYYNGQVLFGSIQNMAVLRYVGELPDDYEPPEPDCDDTNRPSRAYRNGAVLKGWRATRSNNNSAQDGRDGEDWWGSRREVDNVYWPYHSLGSITPSYFRNFSNNNIWGPWRTRTAGSTPLTGSAGRTVRSFHRYNSGRGEHSYELKGYMFAPHTGVYHFSGWGDDQLIVWLSSGPPEPDLPIWNGANPSIYKNHARIGVPDDGTGPIDDGGNLGQAAPGTFEEWFTDDGFQRDNPRNYISTVNTTHSGTYKSRAAGLLQHYPPHNWLMKTGWTTSNEKRQQWWNQWTKHKKAVYLEANKFYFMRLLFSNRGGPGHYGLMWTCDREDSSVNITGYPTFGGFSCDNDAPPSDSTGPGGGNNSGGGGGCFTGHMKIAMADDTQKQIADVQVGDMVKSLNLETDELEDVAVQGIMKPRQCVIYKLQLDNGTTIETTVDHPFRTSEGTWSTIDPDAEEMMPGLIVDCGKLEIGTSLKGIQSNVNITGITNTGRTETVHHLYDVGEHHNFFVEGMCVHNVGGNDDDRRATQKK